jgi:hypothetical protein
MAAILVQGITACSDDPADGPNDAGFDGGPGDSGVDASACVNEPFPSFGKASTDTATRIPLDALCGTLCPASEVPYRARYTCHDILPDGGIAGINPADAGLDGGGFRWWARSEGCDQIEYHVLAPSWPRYFVFAADGGALLGAGQLDDVPTPRPGTSCVDNAYVAGRSSRPCADAAVQYCEREPGLN